MAKDFSSGSEKPKTVRTTLGDRVRANAEENRIPHEESGWWLNARAVPFEPHLVLDQTEVRTVAEGLLDKLLDGRRIRQRDRWIEALAVLLGNLLEAWRSRPKHPVHISRNETDWSDPKRYSHLSHVIELTDLLHAKGYIEMKKGYYYYDDSKETRIWALPDLLRAHRELLCAAVTIKPVHEPVELYERKERKTDKRKLIDYRDTEFTHRVRKILNTANEVIGRATIEYDDGFEQQRVKSYIKAIFIGKFTWYGRFHTYGCRHVQGLSEYDREMITIDGESVVEKDFSGMHPRLLYAQEGIQYLPDPYTMVVRELLGRKGDAGSRSAQGRVLRSFLKVGLLALLNANDFRQAEQAVNNWLYKHPVERRDIHALGITRARPVLEALIEAHQPISHYFCSGKLTGLRTMNKDARIAMDVIWHFVRQGIVVLPIHDSFITKAQYADELERIMAAAYRKHTGGFSCPIK